MSDPISVSRALRAAIHDSMVSFLRLELVIASTMLVAAETTRSDVVRQRRRSLADEACSAVRGYLDDRRRHTALSGAERAELARALAELQQRRSDDGRS
jgi:hypothetical protein